MDKSPLPIKVKKAIAIIGGDTAVSGISGGIDTLDSGVQQQNETSQIQHEEIYVDDHEDEDAINITDKDGDGTVSFSNAKDGKDTDEGGNREDVVVNVPSKKRKRDIGARVADIEHRKLKIMEEELEVSKKRLEVEIAIEKKLGRIVTALARSNTAHVGGQESYLTPSGTVPTSYTSDDSPFFAVGSSVFTSL